MENTILKKIVDEASKRGHDVSLRNIAYALMRVKFDDMTAAYTVVHGSLPEKEEDVLAYDSMDSIQFLIFYFKRELDKNEDVKNGAITKLLQQQQHKRNNDDVAISFEENYAGAVEQLQRIADLRNRCDKNDIKTLKDLEKAESDIRVRLVDKFDVQKEDMTECIIVPKVYDYICPWTRRECYQIGKEEAMEKWDLIEKNK